MIINGIEKPAIIKLKTGNDTSYRIDIKEINFNERTTKIDLYTEDKKSQSLLNDLYGHGMFKINIYMLTENDNIIKRECVLLIQNNIGRFGGRFYCEKIRSKLEYDLNEKEQLKIKTLILRHDKSRKN